MANVSVSTLVAGARLYADERPSGATAFLPDSDISAIVIRSITKIRNEIILARGHEQFVSTSSFATSSGTAYYQLPSDYQQSLTVELLWSSGCYEHVDPIEHREHAAVQTINSWQQGTPKGYRIWNTSMLIEPTPSAATSVEHRYIQRIDTTATSFDFEIDGWDEWVMLDAAAALLMIQGKPSGMVVARRDEEGERIKRMTEDRHALDAQRIVDVGPDRARESRWWPGR